MLIVGLLGSLLLYYISTYLNMLVTFKTFHEKKENMTYILIWSTKEYREHIAADIFEICNCAKQNCFLTSDQSYFSSVTMFDVLIFREFGGMIDLDFPDWRSSAQQYIFGTPESAQYYPLCEKFFDDFFNWTWTYKLNSDLYFGYITIRDKDWNIIGPKENMHWVSYEEMKNTNLHEVIIDKLKWKRKAAAWFVTHCNPLSERNKIANNLRRELKKYGLVLDIYGDCGNRKCLQQAEKECNKMVQEDYYFYLTFENSIAKDYVTEKLLRPLKNYAVPVVYGGANYSRFMPDGSYLDASKHNTSALAKQMNDLIKNRTKYYEYFKWHNYYTYHNPNDYPDSNKNCALCAFVTDVGLKMTKHGYHRFTDWWNEPGNC